MSLIVNLRPEQVVAVLSVGLGEPPDVPPACSSVLVSCLSLMLDPELSFLYSASQKQMVCAQVMRFLAAPRSVEDIERLYKALHHDSCRCDQGPAILRMLATREHGRALGNEDDKSMRHGDDLTELVCSMIRMLSEDLDKCRFLRSSDHIQGKQAWPKSIDELLPGGVLTAIPQVTYWTYAMLDMFTDIDAVVALMNPIFCLVGPPAIIAWMRTPMLWKIIQQIISESNEDDGSGKLGAHCVPDMIAISMLLKYALDQLFDEELEIALQEHPTFTAQKIRDMLLQGLIILSKFTIDNNDIYTRLKTEWELSLSRLLLHLPPPVEGLHRYTADRMHQVIQNRKIPARMLYRLCFGPVWDYRCYGPSCIMTRSTPATHFQRCGGCHTTRYCSRACQKRAWSYAGAAHRDMCGFYGEARKIEITLKCSLDDETKFMNGLLRHFTAETISAACTNMKTLISTQVDTLRKQLKTVPVDPLMEMYDRESCWWLYSEI